MNEIILLEDCFGSNVLINGESLFEHEYDNRDPKLVGELKNEVISTLFKIKNELDMNDWSTIIEIIMSRSDDYEYDVEKSKEGESCDQCGNWNHKYVYNKVI
jgi:hypothetical protein